MKKLFILLAAINLTIFLGHAQEQYGGLVWIQGGSATPVGDYSNVLSSGMDLGADIMQPTGPHVGVGLGIHFSRLEYKTGDYDGNYRILFSNGYLALGSFTRSPGFFAAGLLGAGLRFAFKAERKPNYTTFPYSPVTASTTNVEPNGGYWLGGELGGVIGYRLSENFGICGKVQYDYLTKFIEGSSYFSAKAGLFFGLN